MNDTFVIVWQDNLKGSHELNRRRYIKYISTSVVAVAVVGIGAYYGINRESPLSPQTSLEASSIRATYSTPTTRSTTSKTRISTSTVLPKVSFHGKALHDYNGNGKLDEGELYVADIGILLKNIETEKEFLSVTDSDGGFGIDNLPQGEYQLSFQGEYPENDFRYWTDGKKIYKSGLDTLTIDDKIEMDIALLIGPYTLPFPKGTPIRVSDYFDVDYREKHIRDWKGRKNTYDGHTGTDFKFKDVPVLSAASGTVIKKVDGSESKFNSATRNSVAVTHGIGSSTGYFHLKDGIIVNEEQKVSRGEIIGYSGYTKASKGRFHHLHFGLFPGSLGDLYRDIKNPRSKCWWTKDNDPQFSE